MRSVSSATCAAANAALGAGVLGWPTSRWTTVSPAASFSAAAAITSMTMNGSTAAPLFESLPDISGLRGGREKGQPSAGRIDGARAGVGAAAQARRAGDGIDPAALPPPCIQRRDHALVLLDGGAR